MNLRTAAPSDAAAVADVYLRAWAIAMPFVTNAHDDDQVRAWIRDRLVPTGRVLVAEVDGAAEAESASEGKSPDDRCQPGAMTGPRTCEMRGVQAWRSFTPRHPGLGVIGMVAHSEEDGAFWIDQLYIDPTWSRRGVGTALLEHALALAPRGMPVRLYSFQANVAARAFYERHGFRAIAFGDGSGNEERCPDVLYEKS